MGSSLLETVVAYSGFEHRTGTPGDTATSEWLAERLRREGAKATIDPWSFDRYVGSCRLTADGDEVDAEPFYYSGLGRTVTTEPVLARVSSAAAGRPEEMIAASDPDAPATIVATGNAEAPLTLANADPDRAIPRPIIQVAGREYGRLSGTHLLLEFEAHLAPGRSQNVIAWFGQAVRDPYVVLTPISGWYSCAGERGTGIAIGVATAARLAERYPVLFLGTSGHELSHLGARRLRSKLANLQPRAVLHLGASVAAGERDREGQLELGLQRFALTATVAEPQRIGDALAPGRFQFHPDAPGPWPGEGEEWRERGVPVLSLLGATSTFHTREDVPDHVTSSELLETVVAAVLKAARLLPA